MRRWFPFALLLTACTGVTELGAPPKPFPAEQTTRIRAKADVAAQERRFDDAWNLDVEAGVDRDRLENLAATALEQDRGPYEAMFEQLRLKYGALTPPTRARVDAVARKAEADRDWVKAARVQILAADDPPAYAAAWAVYDRAPAQSALAVLRTLRKAREDWDEAHAKPGK